MEGDDLLIDSVELTGPGLPGGVVTIRNKDEQLLSSDVRRGNFCVEDKITYKLTVKVADKYEAGTNSNVYARIVPAKSECLEKSLDEWGNDFGRDSEYGYEITCAEPFHNCVEIRVYGGDGLLIESLKLTGPGLPKEGTTIINKDTKKQSNGKKVYCLNE